MKKLPMVSASVVSGIVLAISLSSPVFAQYPSSPTTQTYSANSAVHDEDDHDNKPKSTQKYVSKDKHEDNDTSTKNDDQKEHLDCHIKDNSGNQDNYAKYGNRPNCDKTAVKPAPADETKPTSAVSQADQAQPTVLPNTGPGNIVLTAAIITAAGYAANLLRFKYRAQQ